MDSKAELALFLYISKKLKSPEELLNTTIPVIGDTG